MPIMNMRGGQATPMDALVNALHTTMTEQGTAHVAAAKGLTMAVESYGQDDHRKMRGASSTLQGAIVAALESLAEGSEEDEGININLAYGTQSKLDTTVDGKQLPGGLTRAGLQAATMVALAGADPVAYARAATDTSIKPSNYAGITATSEGTGGAMDHSKLVMASESFGEQPLRSGLQWSVVFNAAAAQQDPFGTAFYRPVILSPNEGGLAVIVARSTIIGRNERKYDSKANDLGRRNLIDAARYPALLEDESTRIFPVVEEDGSNANIFVDPALYAAKGVVIEDFEFKTAPLKPGRIGLIEASTPGFLRERGVMDTTDEISNGVRLETVLVKIGDDVLEFGTRYLPYSGFNKTQEGDERLIGLNFSSRELPIDGRSKNVGGAAIGIAALLEANGYTARLSVQVSGTLNTRTSELQISCTSFGLDSLIDKDGTDVGTGSGVGKQIKDALDASAVLGYTLFAVRTNENKRQLGLLLDRLEERFVYNIPLSAPISVLAPAATNKAAGNLEALIDAQRQRCSNDAVTSIFNHAGLLSEYVTAVRKKAAIPRIGAAGHLLVKAFYEKISIDAKEALMALEDKDKAVSISALLTNIIKDAGVRMLIATNYPSALASSLTGSKEAKLLVGTDNYIAQHLLTQGDLRTFGAIFKDPIIVPTLNEKMDGKIFVTLTRENTGNIPDILEYGWLGYIPELISVLQVSRFGNTRDEAMVQARYLHINNLPMLVEIDVTNLSEALTQKVAIKVETTPGQGGPGDEEVPSGNGVDAGNGEGVDTGNGTAP